MWKTNRTDSVEQFPRFPGSTAQMLQCTHRLRFVPLFLLRDRHEGLWAGVFQINLSVVAVFFGPICRNPRQKKGLVIGSSTRPETPLHVVADVLLVSVLSPATLAQPEFREQVDWCRCLPLSWSTATAVVGTGSGRPGTPPNDIWVPGRRELKHANH